MPSNVILHYQHEVSLKASQSNSKHSAIDSLNRRNAIEACGLFFKAEHRAGCCFEKLLMRHNTERCTSLAVRLVVQGRARLEHKQTLVSLS